MKKILLSSALCASLAFAGADVLPVEKRTFDQSKFIPDISLILDASYVSRNADQDEVAHYEVPGIAHGLLGSHSHDGETHAAYNANEGFNLNYGELVLSSSVDPYFSMEGVFHLSEHGFEIEEAYFTSTALEHGLRVKGGKFNSNFGYLNEQHHHAWDFADMPLVYEAFLGMHGINEIGAQVQWIAPTPFYLMAGVEVLQGENEQMFGNATIGDPEIEKIAEHSESPSLYVGYLKSSFDLDKTTILGGISLARGASRIDHSGDDENPHAFSGMSSLYGADLVVKHAFDSYSFLKLQSEYLSRKMDGEQYSNMDLSVDPYTYNTSAIVKEQSGLYTQLIYAHDKNWHMGARYDVITQNDVSTNPSIATDMSQYSAMLEYNTSEFARFRVQYNHSDALYSEAPESEQQHIDTIIFQANISIGAHAAHSF
jgi:hypothetical protein